MDPLLTIGVLALEAQTDVRFADISDIAVDSAGNVYLLTRGQGAVVVYAPDGRYLSNWGIDRFVLPHGITIDGDDNVYIVDQGEHTARVYTTKGDDITVMGTPGKPSDTGVDWSLPSYKERYISTTRGGPPFNNPTKVALAPDGTLYVSDGYGNARVHHFSPDGALIRSWGQPGSDPGEFRLPHSVCVLDDGRVPVADRENDRIQCFTPAGELIEIWDDVQRPMAIVALPTPSQVIVVAEMAWRKGDHSFVSGEVTETSPAGVSVLDGDGRLLDRLRDPEAIRRPHGLGIDGSGTVYLAQLGRPGQPFDSITTLVPSAHGHR